MSQIKVTRIPWVGVNTSKYKEMILFLRDVLGCAIRQQDDVATAFQLPSGDLFEVFNAGNSIRNLFKEGAVPEFMVDDVVKAKEILEEAGVKFLSQPEFSGGYSWAHFLGPDGNVYGIAAGNYDEPRLFFEEKNGDYFISTNKKLLQPEVIHSFLSKSYWAKNRPMEKVIRSIENSLCFGMYYHETQVGFSRVISDYITLAWIADVFVLEEYRGKGLGKWMMRCVMNHPELTDMRRWVLATKDAHGLYSQSGFKPLIRPERW
ncbi:MAG: GNAT family N-acetyltransferase, partial [Chitinophagales bacterium]